eukprot:3213685-Amphidinium_carterae.1
MSEAKGAKRKGVQRPRFFWKGASLCGSGSSRTVSLFYPWLQSCFPWGTVCALYVNAFRVGILSSLVA